MFTIKLTHSLKDLLISDFILLNSGNYKVFFFFTSAPKNTKLGSNSWVVLVHTTVHIVGSLHLTSVCRGIDFLHLTLKVHPQNTSQDCSSRTVLRICSSKVYKSLLLKSSWSPPSLFFSPQCQRRLSHCRLTLPSRLLKIDYKRL